MGTNQGKAPLPEFIKLASFGDAVSEAHHTSSASCLGLPSPSASRGGHCYRIRSDGHECKKETMMIVLIPMDTVQMTFEGSELLNLPPTVFGMFRSWY